VRLALALVLVVAACGDGKKTETPDSGMQPMPDAMADASNPEATFTSYVIELITNQTSNTTPARPYAEFATLPDPDTSNGSAYQSLF
jgi:hypothetical protein